MSKNKICFKLAVLVNLIFYISLIECTYRHHRHKIHKSAQNTFNLYWNVPSFQCRSHKVYFTGLAEKYNFVQNTNDDFLGDKIVILYDPGVFPALIQTSSGNMTVRNGGAPQEGNLDVHFAAYSDKLQQSIPNTNFNGVAIIDMESWRPIFRQNWGTFTVYKNFSFEIERQRHPYWNETLIQNEAIRRFETAAKDFMKQTVNRSKQARPNATWGYYGFPYCFNMQPPNFVQNCDIQIQAENDKSSWIYTAGDIISPSLYLPENTLNATQRRQMMEGRVQEAMRIKGNLQNKPRVIPYQWYKYQDTGNFTTREDLLNTFIVLKSLGTDGVILWGSSNDVNTAEKCLNLHNYIDVVLGPAWLEVTQSIY